MLNEMVDATRGMQFKHSDFDNILGNYSTYLKGELKDYMLIYMDDSDYSNFILFLTILKVIVILTISSLKKSIWNM